MIIVSNFFSNAHIFYCTTLIHSLAGLKLWLCQMCAFKQYSYTNNNDQRANLLLFIFWGKQILFLPISIDDAVACRSQTVECTEKKNLKWRERQTAIKEGKKERKKYEPQDKILRVDTLANKNKNVKKKKIHSEMAHKTDDDDVETKNKKMKYNKMKWTEFLGRWSMCVQKCTKTIK